MKKPRKITRQTENSFDLKANRILTCAALMIAGLIALKYLPMYVYGKTILFDASAHLTATFFLLYAAWNFIESKNQRTAIFLVGIAVLALISYQRISVGAHNIFGLLLGMIISVTAIALSERIVK